MSFAWLNSVIRARQIQEDTARRHVVQARRAARTLQNRALRTNEFIDDLCERVDVELTAPAFVAAHVALQSAAAAHAAAVFAAGQAELAQEAREAELRAAATARSAAEKLQEKKEAAERLKEARAEQAALDETAARIHFEKLGANT